MNGSNESKVTLAGRMAAALAALIVSVPVLGLVWFMLNTQLGLFTSSYLPFAYLAYAILALAVIGFAFPRLVDGLIGGLYGLLRWIAKLW